MQIKINDKCYETLLKLAELSGIQKSEENVKIAQDGTLIKLLIYDQKKLYNKDQKNFNKGWRYVKNKAIDSEKYEDINLTLPEDIIKSIKDMKEKLTYSKSIAEFIYCMVELGIKNTLHHQNLSKKKMKEVMKEISSLNESIREIYEADDFAKSISQAIHVSEKNILNWEMMKYALDLRFM